LLPSPQQHPIPLGWWIVSAGRGEDDQKRGEGMMIRRRRGDDDDQKRGEGMMIRRRRGDDDDQKRGEGMMLMTRRASKSKFGVSDEFIMICGLACLPQESNTTSLPMSLDD
jgi:hypothetical protein